MGKGTIKARKINWLRLFLVKILGVAKSGKSHAPQNLSSGCVTLITGSIPRVEVSIDGERPPIARVGGGSLADHRAQARLSPDPLDLCPQADRRGCNLANGSGVKHLARIASRPVT